MSGELRDGWGCTAAVVAVPVSARAFPLVLALVLAQYLGLSPGARAQTVRAPGGRAAADAGPALILLPVQTTPEVPEAVRQRTQRALEGAVRGGLARELLSPAQLANCAGDGACILRRVRALGGDRAVETSVGSDPDTTVLRVRVRDVRSRQLLADRVASVEGAGVAEADAVMAAMSRQLKGLLVEARQPRASLLAKRPAGARQPLGSTDGSAAPLTDGIADDPEPAVRRRGGARVGSRGARPRNGWRRRRFASERPVGPSGAPLPGTQSTEQAGPKQEAEDSDWLSGLGSAARSSSAPGSWRQRFSRFGDSSGDGGRRARLSLYFGWASLAFAWGFVGVAPALSWVGTRRRERARRSGEDAAAHRQLLARSCEQMTPGLLMSMEFETVRHFHFGDLQGDRLRIRVTDFDRAEAAAFQAGTMLCLQFSHEGRSVIGMATVQELEGEGEQPWLALQAPTQLADIVVPNSFCVPVPPELALTVSIEVAHAVAEPRGDQTLAGALTGRVTEVGSRVLRLVLSEDCPQQPNRDRTLALCLTVGGERAAVVRGRYVGTQQDILTFRLLDASASGGGPVDTSLEAYHALLEAVRGAWVAPGADRPSAGPD